MPLPTPTLSPYRANETVFDRLTKTYYKIERVRTIRIQGKWRTFYRLKGVIALTPDQAWREANELNKSDFRKSSLFD
jgi:hypothetical protein